MSVYRLFEVDYYFQKPGSSRTRTKFRGSVGQHLRGATTENAVLAYLRSRHLGCEILLMKLEWS
jgi:hypothetical protein